MEYRYKAFISYRHQSPDQDIAKRLHTYIENYAIPASLKKALGVQKMGRVFRDQEELPLSSNLGDDIHEALEQSEWLICICSPRYLESKWCLEEVRYFLSLGRRDRILTVLAEGEPDRAFPEQLRFRQTDDGTEEVEPLAADVRAAAVSESLKKLQNEKLRIMAPMLGVRYDDLRQRAKQRRTRLVMAAGAAVILLLASFLGYAFRKNAQITAERNDALIAESKWLAQTADNTSDRMTRLLLYLEALPEDPDDPDRPVVDSAEKGLINTVIAGVSDNTYRHVATMEVEDKVAEISSSNRDLYVIGKDDIYHYDTATGDFVETLATRDEDIFGAMVVPDRGYYVFYQDGYQKVSFETGKTFDYEYPEPSGREYSSSDLYHGVVYGATDYAFYGDLTNLYLGAWRRTEDFVRSVRASHDNGAIYVLNNETPGQPSVFTTRASEFSSSGGHSYVIDAPARYAVYTYTYTPRDASDSPDGDTIMGVSSSRLYFWEKDSETLLAVVDKDRFDGTGIHQAVFSPGKYSYLAAVTTEGGNAYLYDYKNDTVLRRLDSGFTALCSVCWNYDGTRLLCAAGDDGALLFTAEDGREIQRLDCGFNVRQATYADRDCNGNGSTDNYILLSSALSSARTRIAVFSLNGDTESRRYKTLIPVESRVGQLALSADGNTVWVSNNGNSLVSDYNPLTVFDADTGEALVTFDDEHGTALVPFGRYMAVSNNDDTPTYLRIYDTADRTVAATLLPHYDHILKSRSGDQQYDHSTKTTIREVAVSAGGKYLTVSSGDGGSSALSGFADLEAYAFVYDAETFTELWHVGVYDPRAEAGNVTVAGTENFTGALHLYLYDAGNGQLLLMYAYANDKMPTLSRDNYLAFERRDARTGEVLETYVPEGKYQPYFSAKQGLLFLSPYGSSERDDNIVFTLQSFDDIAADYYAAHDAEDAEPQSEETKDLYDVAEGEYSDLIGATVRQKVGQKLLCKSKDQYFVLRIPTLKEAIDSAGAILNGRELTEAQRQTYFLS